MYSFSGFEVGSYPLSRRSVLEPVAELRGGRHALGDFVLARVPHHHVDPQGERTVLGFADALVDPVAGAFLVEEVVGDRVARLHRAHDLAEALGTGGVVDVAVRCCTGGWRIENS